MSKDPKRTTSRFTSGASSARPSVPPKVRVPTINDPQRTITYSVDELEGEQGGASQGPSHGPAVEEVRTITPGDLYKMQMGQQGHQAPSFREAATMLHDSRPTVQMQQGAMVPSMTQRHPAVKRLPHEEVSVEARTVDATFPDPLLVVQHEPDSAQAAAYRVLGHRVTRPAGMRTVMVTSAEERDGKTTCAINLAMALSEGGRATVLLVEANLRQPAIARALGFEPPLCFEAQLRAHKEQPMSPWTITRVTQWMHVVAVDPRTFTRAQMIDALGVELAIEHFKRLPYDFIVVDTPAVMGQADVTLMHDCVDGVLLTAIAGESDGGAIRKATQLLAPANILGVALLEG